MPELTLSDLCTVKQDRLSEVHKTAITQWIYTLFNGRNSPKESAFGLCCSFSLLRLIWMHRKDKTQKASCANDRHSEMWLLLHIPGTATAYSECSPLPVLLRVLIGLNVGVTLQYKLWQELAAHTCLSREEKVSSNPARLAIIMLNKPCFQVCS